MSDIPELDHLIDESENIRRNIKWRKQDRFYKLCFIVMLYSLPIFILTVLFFGPDIASIALIIFSAAIVLLVCKTFFEATTELFKDDWKGVDMTKKYYRK